MTTATAIHPKIVASMPFLEYLVGWQEALPTRRLSEIVEAAGGPGCVALISVDLIKGFTHQGALSSPRVGALVSPIVGLVQAAHGLGVRRFVFMQDAHPEDSPEFDEFPPHCTVGSEEAEMVDELKSLPFADSFVVLNKKSLCSAQGTELNAWLEANTDVRCFILVGDCTDLCLYQAAMHLQMRANVHHHAYEVVVPADCAATYDLPVAVACEMGALAHDGDLLHRVFLHQMALNGVQVVASLAGQASGETRP